MISRKYLFPRIVFVNGPAISNWIRASLRSLCSLVCERSIHNACARDEDMINAICEEERELNPKQAEDRETWREIQQEERPAPEDSTAA